MDWLIHNLLPFLIVLTILVFFHELGHFLAARRYGVKVDAFSIGFGPELFGWNDSKGTRWKFSIIPLGGYVKMFGDADASSKPDKKKQKSLTPEEFAQTLEGKTPWQKAVVAASGPLANFLLAIVFFATLFVFQGIPTDKPVIGTVYQKSLAAKSGIMAGDEILKFNGADIQSFKDLAANIKKNVGESISLDIKRDDQMIKMGIDLFEEKDGEKTPINQLGIMPSYEKVSVFWAIPMAIESTWDFIVRMLEGIGSLITGQSKGELGGIIAIGDMASKSFETGIFTLIYFMTILSINLGLLNLFPIPMLDGGHIVLAAIEGATGRPVNEKVQEVLYFIGFAFVMSIMVIATWSDIKRYKVIQMITSLFS